MAANSSFTGQKAAAGRMHAKRVTHNVLLVLLAGASAASLAQSRFDEEFDDLNKPWQEIAVQLPAMPKKENLLSFVASETATMRFAVDAKSISVGNDGVVRYTLVSSSPSGAQNISYEGIRCQTQEKKLYAFGHKDGNWSRSRRDRWERFTGATTNRQHATLAYDYFCDHRVVAGNAEQLVRNLRDNPVDEKYLPD